MVITLYSVNAGTPNDNHFSTFYDLNNKIEDTP